MLTERDVMLMALHHEKTPWVPATLAGQDLCVPSAVKAGSRSYGLSADWHGIQYFHREDQPSSMPIESDPLVKDIESWRDDVKFPNLDDYDWGGCAARDTANWDRENRLSSLILINGLFESLHMCCGMEDALCYLLTNPEEVKDFISAMADHKIEVIKYLKKYYNPDKIQFHDDYGNAKSTFMNPETWRELIKPSLKRVIEETHKLGIIYEHHSCGYIVPLIEDLIELGVDAWNPVQIFNDPAALQKKYGDKMCFVGGFDSAVIDVPGAKEEDIQASLEKTIRELGEGGSWIAAPSFIGSHAARNRIWLKVLDHYNEPKMEKFGLKPPKHNVEAICSAVFRKYSND